MNSALPIEADDVGDERAHAAVVAPSSSASNCGKLVAIGEVSSTSTPSRLARPATAIAIAMRWSRWVWRGCCAAAQRLAAGAVDDQAVLASRRPRAGAGERGGHAARRSRFLDPQLVEPAGHGAPSAIAAATNSTGNSSIMLGASAGSTSMPVSAEWRTRKSATGSPPTSRAFELLDAAAHLAQHLVEPGAGRVEADVLDHEVAAGHDQRGDGEERGRRGIAGHLDRLRAQVGLAAYADHALAVRLLDPQLGAEALEHALGVVACRNRLDHGRDPCRVEARRATPRSSPARWLRASGR
jgi:hypothetical protein